MRKSDLLEASRQRQAEEARLNLEGINDEDTLQLGQLIHRVTDGARDRLRRAYPDWMEGVGLIGAVQGIKAADRKRLRLNPDLHHANFVRWDELILWPEVLGAIDDLTGGEAHTVVAETLQRFPDQIENADTFQWAALALKFKKMLFVIASGSAKRKAERDELTASAHNAWAAFIDQKNIADTASAGHRRGADKTNAVTTKYREAVVNEWRQKVADANARGEKKPTKSQFAREKAACINKTEGANAIQDDTIREKWLKKKVVNLLRIR